MDKFKIVKNRYFLFFSLFLSYFLLFSSCRTKKNLQPGKIAKCKLDYKSAKTLTSLLKQHQAEYSTFSGKVKTNIIIDDKGTDFTVALRMKKDSIIWASISPALGIEVVRFIATKDSIKFIDRLHNRFFAGEYDTLSKMLNAEIDLEILQSLLIGNSVEFYEEDEKLRSGIDSCQYTLGTIRKRKWRKVMKKGKELKEPAQNIWMHDSTFKISRILFREFETNREFDAHFENFQNVDLPTGQTSLPEVQNNQVTIPFILTYVIKADKIITINLEYTKASANKQQSFPFTIPEGYEKIGK